MDNLMTVISFSLSHDAHFAKGKLQSEGIKVFIKDELTAHVKPLYSSAIGDIKLQVRSTDVDTANRILVDSGYIREHTNKPNKMLMKLDKWTCHWPLVGGLGVELRLLITVAVVFAIVVVAIVLVALP
ncbi:MAG: DUF2007 domain-containing protein [Bacteroidales bacterium]|nr:DUF2007 domain-containing protein [Bacteroidales bacterium]